MTMSEKASPRRLLRTTLLAAVGIALVLTIWHGAVDGLGNSGNQISSRLRHAVAQERSRELYSKYLPGLVSQAQRDNLPGFANDDIDELDHLTSTIVIGRLQNETEKVQWVYNELRTVQNKEIYIVDDAETTAPHLNTNHGREAAVYLTYILDNYDNLSNITFFWHTDKIVWHNNLMLNWDSVATINKMDRANILRKGYVPSRCDQWPGCPSWIKFNPSKAEYRLDPHRLEDMFTPDLFSRLFPDEKTPPPYYAGTCCSQFAVSRETIRSRPRETYKRILDWVLDYQDDSRSGRIMEYLWPYIFLGRGTLCPSMRECYCETYNFCMDDQRDIMNLVNWNDLRTRREEMQWQVNFIKDLITAKANEMGAGNIPTQEINATLESLHPEFDRLSSELDRLSQSTWELREDIIRRWKLGMPPVGW